MKQKDLWAGIFSAFGIFLLILDGQTALEGAREGLLLCLRTVIPGLLPFFLLSNLLTGSLMGKESRGLSFLEQLTGIPKGAGSLLIPAFLGGYPMGAQCTARACEKGQLDRKNAERMLFFCNNAGPAFLFGVLGPMFTERWMVFSLWGIHICTALWISSWIPPVPGSAAVKETGNTDPSQAMAASLKAMALVCGWVICFRVFTKTGQKWLLWRLSRPWQVLLMGFTELTGGCCMLEEIQSQFLRFLLASGLLGFGGLCAAMQTGACIGSLSLRPYLKGKCAQALLSVMFSCLLYHRPQLLPVLFMIPVLIRTGLKKRGGNSRAVSV